MIDAARLGGVIILAGAIVLSRGVADYMGGRRSDQRACCS